MNLYVVNNVFSSECIFLISSSKIKRRESLRKNTLPNKRIEGCLSNIVSFNVYKNGKDVLWTIKHGSIYMPNLEISGKWGRFRLYISGLHSFQLMLCFQKDGFRYSFTYDVIGGYNYNEGSFKRLMKKHNFVGIPFYHKKNLFLRTFNVKLIDQIFYC